jgi:hypothetical protein
MSKKSSQPLADELKPLVAPFRYDGSGKFHLKSHKTNEKGDLDKEKATKIIEANRSRLNEFQEKLYAQDRWSMLLIFQGMDAAGKDSAIKSVFEGVNPQGCEVTSFKQPSTKELDHDFMWRSMIALPERGRIGIFNRSYYEECIVVRVHKEILAKEKIPKALVTKNIWRALRGHYRDRALPRAQWYRNPEILPQRFQEGAARALSRTAGGACQELEVLACRYLGACLVAAIYGRLPGPDPPHFDEACALAHRAGRPQMVRARGDRLGHRQRAR